MVMVAGALGRTPALAASAGLTRKPQFPNTWESSRSSVSRKEHTRERCASTRCLRDGGTLWGRSAGRREPKIGRNMQHTPFPGEQRASQKELHEQLQARTGRAKRKGRATEEDRYKTMTWPVAHAARAGSWCLPPFAMVAGTGDSGANGTR